MSAWSRASVAGLRTAVRRSRVAFTPLSLAFVVYLVVTEHRRFAEALGGLSAATVAGVFGMIALGHCFIALSSHALFRASGEAIGLPVVVRTHVSSLPARYLPGGVWQTVSRGLEFSARGVARATVVRVLAVEMLISAALAGLLGSALLLWTRSGPPEVLLPVAALSVAALVGAALVLRGGRARAPVSPVSLGLSVLAFAAVWLLYGSAFYLYSRTVVPDLSWPAASGAFLVAWLVGFLAFFAPQGIGVFEVTAGALLTGGVSAGVAASMLGFRVLSMSSDIGLWALFRFAVWLRGRILAAWGRPSCSGKV